MKLASHCIHTLKADQKVIGSPSHVLNNSLNTIYCDKFDRVHMLWISYFTDKLQWYDIGNSKISPKSPSFKHKITKEYLWIDARFTPSWVMQELERGTGKEATVAGMDNTAECVEIVNLLKDCAKSKDLCEGSRVHAHILRRGLFEKSPYVGSTLVSMYAKCGALEKAKKVLNDLPTRNVVCWSALISGYAQHGKGTEALKHLEAMKSEGFAPDAVTFTCALNACAMSNRIDKGMGIHREIVERRLVGKHLALDNALIDMYAKCGALERAQSVLHELRSRDVVSWSALIAGFVRHGRAEEALVSYELMEKDGIAPNTVTWICAMKACGGLKALGKGRSMHDEIEKKASSSTAAVGEDALVLRNAVVDMYAKCDAMAEAQHSLDGLGRRDVISWSSLIAGYVQRGWNEDALRCFEEMKIEGLSPDAVTYSYVLKACGGIAAIERGKETHGEVSSEGLLRSGDAKLGAALVDMYAKCGDLRSARKALEELSEKNVATWNALIAGYAQHGQAGDALECLDRMLREGTRPDSITYVCVLNACAHAALVDEGQMRFAEMIGSHGLMPSSEHYACIVNLFGRVGHFENAAAVAARMPSLDYGPIWSALLGACQSGGNRDLGRLVFQHAVQLDADHCASYVSLSNLHASEDMSSRTRLGSCVEDC